MSSSTKKRIERYSKYNEKSEAYIVPAFLLAQFGKNSSYSGMNHLSGDLLMDFVLEVVANIQYMIGGGILYLECENNEFLLNFYQKPHNNFHLFGERKSESNTLYKLLYRFIWYPVWKLISQGDWVGPKGRMHNTRERIRK